MTETEKAESTQKILVISDSEVEKALQLGMKAIYVRLGIPEMGTPEIDGLSLAGAGSERRPDGVVTRVEDLPKLPIFRSGKEGGRNHALPPPTITRHER
jgi:hypothetical protein